ncbi:MAG: PAS domain S-box protein [Nitrospinae bacterium]|nr:PAS domain S-box protein [Nitrospinota bacterium]MBF0633942.1 PAS domain S-box protein [Nitrospinota bacterium]
MAHIIENVKSGDLPPDLLKRFPENFNGSFTLAVLSGEEGLSGVSPSEFESIQRREELLKAREIEVSSLLESARAVLKHADFKDSARAIFDYCKKVTGATAGYVALLSDDGSENEVLFLDPGGRECTVDPTLPMPIRGLRGEAYKTGYSAYDNDFWHSDWMKFMPPGHVTLDNVLFAPLIIEGKSVGLMGLANKPGGFTERDAKMALAFGELAAIALNNSRTMERLENSEERFRVVAQTAIDAIITIDAASNITFWNKSSEKLFGYSSAEAVGQPVHLIIPERFRQAHAKGMERVVSGGPSKIIGKTIEITALTKSGREFPIELSLASCQTTSGLFFTAIVHDITERKRAEEALRNAKEALEKRVEIRTAELAQTNRELVREMGIRRRAEDVLRESEERYRSFVESFHGIAFRMKPDYTPVFFHGAVEQVTGYSEAEFMTGVPRWDQIIYPPDSGVAFTVDGETRVPGHARPLMREYRIIRKDGQIRWVRKFVHSVSDENGEVLYMQGAVYDITERKQVENELNRLFRAIEQSAESIMIIDANKKIHYVNPAFERVTGYQREEVIGTILATLSSDRLSASLYGEIWGALSKGEIWKGRISSRRKDGSAYEEESVITPVIDSKGTITDYVLVQRDITQEAALSKAKDYFASVTSHELRTPLTKLGLVKLLLRNLSAKEGDHEPLGQITKALDDSITDFDRIISASEMFTALLMTKPSQMTSQANLFLILSYCVEMAKANLISAGRDISIVANIEELDRNTLVNVAQGMIQRALLEILSNAIKYTSNGKKIWVTARCDGGRAVVEIKDEGIGVPFGKKALIFEPFFSLEDHYKHATSQYQYMGGGIGMGLTLSRLIMEYHGGRLELESEGENRGTSVKLIFPLKR